VTTGTPGLTGLRRFVKRPGDGPLPTAPAGARDEAPVPGSGTGQGAAAEAEHCEMCGEVLTGRHGHLVDTDKRSIACACRACYLLFTHEGAAGVDIEVVEAPAEPTLLQITRRPAGLQGAR
jgi:hypothetical protein